MKAAIYTRVSQDRTNQGKSVSSQEQDCRDVCARNGWETVKVYTDNDRSASAYAKKSRPAFERLMADLGKYDVLVTWEASRATRDMEVYVALRAACRVSGVQWSYSGRLYDLRRTDDSFSTGLDMLVAERESSQTRDRVARVVRQSAQEGKPHGRIPFGYTREYDATTGKLLRQVPHPEEAQVIIEGAERVLAGESCYSIAKDFHARGMPLMGNKRWQPQRLSRLLRNPTYAGKRVYRGEVLRDASWPALIPPTRWEALQGIMLAPDRVKFHGSAPAWLLTGIARCGVCGGTMTRGSNRTSMTYTCKLNHCVARRMSWVDDLVVGLVKGILRREDALEAIHEQASPDIAGAAQALAELEARLESFYQQAAEGHISAQGLARVEKSMIEQVEAARAHLRSLSTPQRATIDNPRQVADEWDSLPLERRREVTRGLMEITILPALVPGRRTFDPESVRVDWRH